MACPKIEVRGKRVILLSGFHDTVKAARPQVVLGDADVKEADRAAAVRPTAPRRSGIRLRCRPLGTGRLSRTRGTIVPLQTWKSSIAIPRPVRVWGFAVFWGAQRR